MQNNFHYTGPTYSDGPFTPCRILINADGEQEAFTMLGADGRAMQQPARSAVNVLQLNLVPSWRAYRACRGA